jgi:predicted DsbA family dithiol-disulfide isomerase
VVRLAVWSDYLCPWCHLASARLARLREELGGELELEWRAYLLRPEPRLDRDLERFRTYTRSWRRPAAEADAPAFREWHGGQGPPSHSLPPHRVARAAARVSPEAFDALHGRLLRAYFEESRDITRRDTLEALWREAGLAPEAFAASDDPALEREILDEHRRAQELGVTGVPAVGPAEGDLFLVGAHPLELYRRWVARLRDAC